MVNGRSQRDAAVRNVFDPAHPGTRVYGRGDAILRWDDQVRMARMCGWSTIVCYIFIKWYVYIYIYIEREYSYTQ